MVELRDPTTDPKFIAAVKLIGRTGAQTWRIGYSDEGDGPPTVWYAVAEWVGNRSEAAAALDPVAAALRLCERVIDGGECTHCHQTTIFDDNPGDSPFDALLDAVACVYAWDPELQTFRRGCEGNER